MKVVMLYRPDTEFARPVEDFARDLEREHHARVDLVSLDTREGASMASLYGIVQYPAVLVIREDGQLMKEWQGGILPLQAEVSMYTHL